MKLNNMQATPGSRTKKTRVGRGDKTAGRGENGQKSRAGFSNKIGFEGGQNPLYRRIPKRGFTSQNREEITIVNLDRLVKLNLKTITPEILIEKKVIKSSYKKLKILGNSELKTNFEISAHAFSANAKKAITTANGKVNIIK